LLSFLRKCDRVFPHPFLLPFACPSLSPPDVPTSFIFTGSTLLQGSLFACCPSLSSPSRVIPASLPIFSFRSTTGLLAVQMNACAFDLFTAPHTHLIYLWMQSSILGILFRASSGLSSPVFGIVKRRNTPHRLVDKVPSFLYSEKRENALYVSYTIHNNNPLPTNRIISSTHALLTFPIMILNRHIFFIPHFLHLWTLPPRGQSLKRYRCPYGMVYSQSYSPPCPRFLPCPCCSSNIPGHAPMFVSPPLGYVLPLVEGGLTT